MTKALNLYCLILLLAAAPALKAQSPPPDAIDTATDEAVRRAAAHIILRNNLAKAEADRQAGDLLEAARLFEDCYSKAQYIGITAVPEFQEVVSGLVDVRFRLAHRYAESKDYARADEQYARILVIVPGDPTALAEQRENTRLLHLQEGTIPSQGTIEKIPEWRTNEVRVATMVQDGKLLYEAGKTDEAEVKLKEAYRLDPSNVAAYQYLRLIDERRMADATRRSEAASAHSILQVEQAWDVEQRSGPMVPHPNSFNRTNLVYTSLGRQKILSKLDRIHVDTISYDSLPLGSVIDNLIALSKARDPDKTGINFYISHEAPVALGAAAPGAIDPATGLPIAAAPTDTGADVSGVTIKVSLSDVRLADVLDAITKTSDKPIKYSVLDYAIVFSLRSQEPVPLEIRTFHIDPNTFRQGLESVSSFDFGDNITTTSGSGGGGGTTGGTSTSSGSSGGGGGGSSTTTIAQVRVAGTGTTGGGQQGTGLTGAGLTFVTRNATNALDQLQGSVRSFFNAVGVDFNTNKPENVGKAFAWNDRKGVLTVRSTAQDLDMIAAVLETLNQAPPEINIKAKFAEITQDDSRALGFNWTLGNFNLGGSGLIGSGGTQASMNGVSSSANPLGFFPGTATAGNSALNIPAVNTLIAPAASDGVITQGLSNPLNAPTVATLTGILTEPQFQVAVQALQQRGGVDLLTAPEVTTESGRQAEIQAVDLQTIVTQNTASAQNSGGFAGVQNGVNSPIVNQAVLIQPGTQLLPFGPVLDVIPYVSADEFSVQMTIIPTVTEFIGYDNPGQFVVQAQQAAGSAPITAQLPLPHFRMRQVTTSVTVWDSQTLVIGGLITDSVTKEKDQVPFLGDLPLFGRLFRSESSQKTKKNLMIFVTPTIVNPDGTRYHSDEEMPFLQNQSQSRPSSVTQ